MSEDEEKSKSQLKKEAKRLEAFGFELAQLSMAQLEQLPLAEAIVDTIIQYKKISSHVAKKRSLQYLGRLLRGDPDIAVLQQAYDKLISGSHVNSAHIKNVELWRSRLLSDDQQSLTDFLQQYPCNDIQHLRHLIRQAKTERETQKHPGAGKILFRYIGTLIQ